MYGVPVTRAPAATLTPVALLICRAVNPSTASVGLAPDVVCGLMTMIWPSIVATPEAAKLRAVVTAYAVLLPVVVMPPRSTFQSRRTFIMPREESFTLDGAWPSAQLMAESAFEFDPAVCDQFWIPEGMGSPMYWLEFQAAVCFALVGANMRYKWTPDWTLPAIVSGLAVV